MRAHWGAAVRAYRATASAGYAARSHRRSSTPQAMVAVRSQHRWAQERSQACVVALCAQLLACGVRPFVELDVKDLHASLECIAQYFKDSLLPALKLTPLMGCPKNKSQRHILRQMAADQRNLLVYEGLTRLGEKISPQLDDTSSNIPIHRSEGAVSGHVSPVAVLCVRQAEYRSVR